jgi:hypothetical protein
MSTKLNHSVTARRKTRQTTVGPISTTTDADQYAKSGGPEPDAYTVQEFCTAHRISRSKLYQLWDEDTGPRIMRIGSKVLITREAAAKWRRAREAEARKSIARKARAA